MTQPADLDRLRSEYEEISTTLEALEKESADSHQRADIRDRILGLHRTTETAIEELTTLKEEIRTLVQRYKALGGERKPQPTRGLAPIAPRSDHLGSSTYVERGWNAIASGDYARAVEELRRALELAPDEANAETLLGWAQMMREEYDDALLTYHKVLARDPDNPIARVNLGYICRKKGIFGEAIEHLSRVIHHSEDRKAILYATLYMGLVYSDREMYEDARSFFRRTIELGPNLIEAYWELGRAYYLDGNREEALVTWREGVQTNRFNPWGERCEQAIQSLTKGREPELA